MDQKPKLTGFAAYRATVDARNIKADPEISWLLEKPSLNIWYTDLPIILRVTVDFLSQDWRRSSCNDIHDYWWKVF